MSYFKVKLFFVGERHKQLITQPLSILEQTLAVESPGGPHVPYTEMFEVSSASSLLWKCKSCSKEVTNRWHHFHSHATLRSRCPYCPASYSRIDTLRTHLRCKHSEELKRSNIFI